MLTNWAAVNKTQMVNPTNAIFLFLACLTWIVLLLSSPLLGFVLKMLLRHDNMCDKKSFMTHFSLWATDGESQTVVKWAGKMSSFSVSSLNSNLHFCGGNSITKSLREKTDFTLKIKSSFGSQFFQGFCSWNCELNFVFEESKNKL